jgi:hypothetical protein
MSRLYGPEHRALQDQFQSRAMADRIEMIGMKTEISDLEKAFIEGRDMFFLSTVDDRGRPTVSYKGGVPGFVRVLDGQRLAFPNYDGNGMYLSMGNIAGNAEVGLLFVDFEKPFRLRVQGRAVLSRKPDDLSLFKEADFAVIVTVSELWMNCPRYVHRYQKVQTSRYAPQENVETPFCEWKRIDGLQDVLRPHELSAVKKAGQISIEAWMAKVLNGDEKV